MAILPTHDNPARAGIFEHEFNSLRRVFQVDWQIGSPQLEYCEYHRNGLGRPIQRYSDCVPFLRAERKQFAGDLGGLAVEIAIGRRTIIPSQCRPIAMSLRQFGEHAIDGQPQIVGLAVPIPFSQKQISLFVADHVNGSQRSFRVDDERRGRSRRAIKQSLDRQARVGSRRKLGHPRSLVVTLDVHYQRNTGWQHLSGACNTQPNVIQRTRYGGRIRFRSRNAALRHKLI